MWFGISGHLQFRVVSHLLQLIFWDADAGDDSGIDIPEDGCGPIPNAYQKALRILWPLSYGRWHVKYPTEPRQWTFPNPSGGNYIIPNLYETTTTIGIEYNSLFEFLSTGTARIVGYTAINGAWVTSTTDSRLPIAVSIGSPLKDDIVWEALGRVTHLLGDMSVPAHVHNDIHPCWVPIVGWAEGDVHELVMGGSPLGGGPACNLGTLEIVEQYDWTHALSQGGMINVVGRENPIRYLFYSTNQVADHYGSLIDGIRRLDRHVWYAGDNNYNQFFGSDNYEELALIMATLGPPVVSPDPFDALEASTAFIFGIRAIAGLLHWFSVETGLTNNIVVQNDFDGGSVTVNSGSYPSGFTFAQPLGVPLNLSTTTPQTHGDYIRHFSHWEKRRPNGEFVTTFPAITWNTNVDGSFTYIARFNKECNITFANNLVGFGNIGPMRIDGVVYNMPHGSFPVVENQNGIEVVAMPYPHQIIIDGIQYFFSQWSDGSTEPARRLFPNSHQLYTANFVGRPISVSTTLRQTNPTGSFIRLEWNEHQNANVTRYHIWRNVRQGSHSIDFRQVAVVNRGTTAWVDYDYVVAREGSGYVLEYDVRAFYSVENTYAFDYFWVVGFGNSGTPGHADKLAVREVGKPEAFALGAYPNPFNPSTRIIFDLPEDGVVSLAVFDLLGRKVADIVNESIASGAYSVQWDANSIGAALSGGVYFARFTVTDETGKVNKLLLVK